MEDVLSTQKIDKTYYLGKLAVPVIMIYRSGTGRTTEKNCRKT